MRAGESPVAEREELAAGSQRAASGSCSACGGCAASTSAAFAASDRLRGRRTSPAPAIAKFVAAGLLEDDGERVRLTREGLFVSDALWPELL